MGIYLPGSLPTYPRRGAPGYLATRKQLRAEGLSVAGLRPAAWLEYCGWHYTCPLYRRDEARPVRPVTEAQAAALAAGRKLAGTRACARCKTARVPVWDGSKLCGACYWARLAEAEKRHAAKVAQDHADAARWAAEALADERVVYLDTETTGLGAGSWIVEIAILDYQGRELVNTLVNPQEEIPEDATLIHGIRDADVAGAPVFGDIWPDIEKAIEGKRVIIYNSVFDTEMLFFELDRLWCDAEPATGPRRRPWTRHPAAEKILQRLYRDAECAMTLYAQFAGCWSDYHGDYRWLPLNGGHRAAGDCRAVLDLMREMAADAAQADEAGTVPAAGTAS